MNGRRPILPRVKSHLENRAKQVQAIARLLGYAHEGDAGAVAWIVKTIGADYGHIRTVNERQSVDAEGAPIPWYTYPAIEYLKQFDYSTWDTFEYGGGNSSRFWAARSRTLTTVESDPDWYAKLLGAVQPNQTLYLEQDPRRYAEAVDVGDRRYRLIVIDGQHRRACAERAVERLSERGMIVFDNTDWWPQTTAFLRGKGLLQVDFTGIGTINCYTFTTSIFFRRDVELVPRAGRQPEPGIGSLRQVADPE